MRPSGLTFGGAVALGVLLANTLVPLATPVAGAVTVLSMGAMLGNARAWALVPAGLGMLRAAAARDAWQGRQLATDLRATGWVDVLREHPSGALVSVGNRQVLVADSTHALPSPGMSARVLLRMDRIQSRAEPSQFRADAWAWTRGLHARGRCVGAVHDTRPTPGWRGHVRRAAYRVRQRARSRLGAGRSEGRDLVTALVIGDRSGLEQEALDAFRRAGLAHVLALSGMHVGVLAVGLGAMLRAVRLPMPPLTLITLGFLAAFAVLTGGAAPILRACGTGSLAIAATALHRRTPPGHSLGLVAGALLLARPALLFDVGCRLSFLAAGTLAVYARHAPRPAHGVRGALQAVGEALLMSSCVTLATSPEILSSFGALSLLSPVTNLLAALPATLALGWGALAAFAPIPGDAAAVLAAAASRAADVLLAIATVAARLPGGRVVLPAPGPSAVLILLASAAAVATRRRPSRRDLRILAGIALLAVSPLRARDRVTFLDLGQGDATLLEGGGEAVLVDTGVGGWEDLPAPAIAALARRRLRPLSALVLTHGHEDHAGGAEALIEAGRVRQLVIRGRAPNDLLRRIRVAADGAGVSVPDVPPEGLTLLGGRVHVGTPWRTGPPDGTSENDRSLVVRWEVGALTLAIFGDGGFASEEALVADDVDGLRSAVLLLPHHGSRGSGSPAFLAAVRPRLAVISCGQGNVYGHPHAEALDRLRPRGPAVLRTDRDGTITLTASARGFRVRWVRAFPGPPALFPVFAVPGSPPMP